MYPSDNKKLEIYEFYKLIYKSTFTFGKKVTLMTQSLGMEDWSWRVVGISEKAVIEIAKNNYKRPSNKLERDHQVKRADTCKILFNAKLLAFEDWWNLVWENDKTYLVTKDEHKLRQFSKIYPINYTLGYFKDAGKISYKYSIKKEGEYIKSLIIDQNITI